MPTFEQLPADVDLAFTTGDRLQFTVAFDTALTNYAFEAAIIDAGTKSVLITATTAATTASGATTLSVDFADSSTSSLAATGRYSWYLRWKPSGGGYRTVLSGAAKVQQP